jgi:hypothetical protein
MEVTIAEAARLFKVSERTIRRRVHIGELQGRQVSNSGGFLWMVEVPDHLPDDNPGHDETGALISRLAAQVDAQQQQLAVKDSQLESKDRQLEAKDRQIEQLHILLQQAQAALPPPRGRPWWRWWGRD